MLALLLTAALAVLTLALARQLELLGDVLQLIAVCLLAGVAMLGLHDDLEWIAPEREDDGSCSLEGEAGQPAVERVSVEEARSLLEHPEVSFVDARADAHYLAAHIPGALSLPADAAEDMLELQSLPIPPEGEVIAYCDGGSCEQSEYLGLLLRTRGVCRRVRVLEGGWLGWLEAGAPTVSGASRFGDAPSSSVPAGPGAAQPDLEAAG